MAGILRRTLEDPSIPSLLRTPRNWPAAMRAEWSDDFGARVASAHREELVAGSAGTVRLNEFKPDVVSSGAMTVRKTSKRISFRRSQFAPTRTSTSALGARDDVICDEGQEQRLARGRIYVYPPSRQAGHRKATRWLLIERDFDVRMVQTASSMAAWHTPS
jgi:hypothetical protein